MLQNKTLSPYRYYSLFPKITSSFFDEHGFNSKSFSRSESWEKTEKGYNLSMEIPGFGKEDVSLKVKNSILHINISENRNYSYKLSDKYDLNKISANVDKGVLNIEIPFKQEAEPEEIEIKVD